MPRSLEQGASPKAAEWSHSYTCTTHKHTYTLCPTITHNIHTNYNRAAHTHGSLNGRRTSVLLDSGASCSVIAKPNIHHTQIKPIQTVRLINAHGRDITSAGVAVMTIGLGKFSTEHQFVVVDYLSTLVILGCDFF